MRSAASSGPGDWKWGTGEGGSSDFWPLDGMEKERSRSLVRKNVAGMRGEGTDLMSSSEEDTGIVYPCH